MKCARTRVCVECTRVVKEVDTERRTNKRASCPKATGDCLAQELWIVFEFVDTDLQKLMMSPQFFTDLHVKYFLYQILLGLYNCHTAQVIHRDLKPANLLVNADCSLKVPLCAPCVLRRSACQRFWVACAEGRQDKKGIERGGTHVCYLLCLGSTCLSACLCL